MSDSNQQNELVANSVCRFCLLKNEKREFYRIPSYEWPDSPLAAMYESVMKHQLPNWSECLEVCYCSKCSELLCQTFMALQMFERSDAYWANSLLNAPVSPSAQVDDDADTIPEYLDDEAPEISILDKTEMDYFELEAVKMELADYEEPSDCIEVDERFEVINVEITDELRQNDKSPTNNDSPNNTNKAQNTKTVKNKARRKHLLKIIKHVKPNPRNDKLPCLLCNEIFPNRTALNRHTDATHNMVQCIRCPFTTTTRKLLQRHELVEHKRNMDTISPCPKCKKIFTDPFQLRMHDKKAHAPFVESQCHICSKVFSNSYRLKNHMAHIHVEARFECDVCGRKFRQKKYLKLHMSTMHTKEANFICTLCGMTFTNQICLKLHEAKSCQISHTSCGGKRPNAKYSCSLCDTRLSDLPYGRVHYQKVHQIKDVSLVCPICNCLTASHEDLGVHLSEIHSELACPICKRYLKSQITLKNHIATHSTKERLFECTICKATFVKAVHVEGHHKRIHLAERPHKCTDCDLRFAENCEMMAHWRHKHATKDDRKYKCNWCEKRYVSMSALLLHEAVHTGIGKYDCELCGKNFRLVHQLRKHFEAEHPDSTLLSLSS